MEQQQRLAWACRVGAAGGECMEPGDSAEAPLPTPAERAATGSEQRWAAALLDALPMPLYLVDAAAGEVIQTNAAADAIAGSKLSGASVADVLSLHQITDEADRPLPSAETPLARAVAGERGAMEAVWHTPGGRLSLLARATELPAMHGHGRTIILMLQDVSDLKRIATALHQAVRARDDFLSVASHELNTPLTSLRLQAQMALRRIHSGRADALAPARVQRLVEETERSVQRLARLVRDMLDISRLSGSNFSLSPQRFDLAELAHEVGQRFAHEAALAGSSLEVQAPQPVWGTWDRLRVDQVMSNLVTNALRYGAPSPVCLAVEVVDGWARLSVTDTGPGVAAADRTRIFERYERATSASEVSGLGLGLYICHRLVDCHGGGLALECPAAGGASFVALLPMEGSSAPTARA